MQCDVFSITETGSTAARSQSSPSLHLFLGTWVHIDETCVTALLAGDVPRTL
jgi:hypothetical protein